MNEYGTAGIDVLCLRSSGVGRARIRNVQRQMVPGSRLMAIDLVDPFRRAIVPLPELWTDGIAAEVDRIGFDHPTLAQQFQETLALQDDDAIGKKRILSAQRTGHKCRRHEKCDYRE